MKYIIAALLLFAASPALAFPAHVLRCHDGDTCTVDSALGALKIRLAEIDAPEIDQPYGTEAQAVICNLICGRDVEVEPRGQSYDRIVGLIRVGDVDTSEAMVKAGAAWDYPRYDRDPLIPKLEATARAAHLGLWSNPAAIPPWEWRHSRVGR